MFRKEIPKWNGKKIDINKLNITFDISIILTFVRLLFVHAYIHSIGMILIMLILNYFIYRLLINLEKEKEAKKWKY